MGFGEALVCDTNRPPRLQNVGELLSHVSSGAAVITGHDGYQPIGFVPGALAVVSAHPPYMSSRPPRSATNWLDRIYRATGSARTT